MEIADNDTRPLVTEHPLRRTQAQWAHGWRRTGNGGQVSSLLDFQRAAVRMSLCDSGINGDPFKSDANFTVNHAFTRDITRTEGTARAYRGQSRRFWNGEMASLPACLSKRKDYGQALGA